MARTVRQIYSQLVAEKNTHASLNGLQPSIDTEQTLLSDLTTPSRVADWRLWLYIVAFAIWTHEMLWDLFRIEIDAKAANSRYGSSPWFQQQSFAFQFGDVLQWINNQFQYADTTSPTALTSQIIKRAAIVETGGQVRIKVAKLIGGVVTKLTSAELSAFDAYILKIKPAGTNTFTLSRDADQLKLSVRAFYDPEVLAADGSLLTDPTVFPLEDAINNYIGNLPFSGHLVLTFLIDAMQASAGIVNPELLDAQAKFGAVPYASIVTEYIPDAGYLAIDGAFPLNTSITYLPNV